MVFDWRDEEEDSVEELDATDGGHSHIQENTEQSGEGNLKTSKNHEPIRDPSVGAIKWVNHCCTCFRTDDSWTETPRSNETRNAESL